MSDLTNGVMLVTDVWSICNFLSSRTNKEEEKERRKRLKYEQKKKEKIHCKSWHVITVELFSLVSVLVTPFISSNYKPGMAYLFPCVSCCTV